MTTAQAVSAGKMPLIKRHALARSLCRHAFTDIDEGVVDYTFIDGSIMTLPVVEEKK